MTENWRDNFKTNTIRTNFMLSLTRPMMEFISAVADDVSWDRSSLGSCLAAPNNFLATARSLEKRGLIVRKSQNLTSKKIAESRTSEDLYSWSHYILTPAGDATVELLKIAGLFIEANAAVLKKSKAAG